MIINESETIKRQKGDLNSLKESISSNQSQKQSLRSEYEYVTISLSLQSNDRLNLGLSDILAFYSEIDYKLFDTRSNLTFVHSEQIYYNNIEQIKNMRIILQTNSQSKILQAFIPQTREMIIQKVIVLDSQETFIQKLDEYKIHYLINQKYPKTSLQLFIPVIISKYQQNYCAQANIEKAKFNLYDYSRKHKISNEQAYYIFITILDQIIGLHKLKIAHRDVKPQNILYTEEKGWVLSDFGESQEYSELEACYGIRGTKYFLIPKIQQQIALNAKKFQQNLLQNDLFALVQTILMIQQNEPINGIQNKLTYCKDDYLIKIINIHSIDELIIFKANTLQIQFKVDFNSTESIYKEMTPVEEALNKKFYLQNLVPLHNFYYQENIYELLRQQIFDCIEKDKRVLYQKQSDQVFLQIPGFQTKVLAPQLQKVKHQVKIHKIDNSEQTMIFLFICGYNEQTIAFGNKFLSKSYNQRIHFYLILATLRIWHFDEADQQLMLFNQGLLFDQLETELQEYYFIILSNELIVSRNQAYSLGFQPDEQYQKEIISEGSVLNYIQSEIKLYSQNQIEYQKQIVDRLFASLKKTCSVFTTENFCQYEQQIFAIKLHLPIEIYISIIQRILDYNFDLLDLNRKATLISYLAQSFTFIGQIQNAKYCQNKFQYFILRSDSKQQIISFRIFQLLGNSFLLKANFDDVIVKLKRQMKMLPHITYQLYRTFIMLNSFDFLCNIVYFNNIKNQSQILFIVEQIFSLAKQLKYHKTGDIPFNEYHQYAQYLLLKLRNKKRQHKLVQDHYKLLNLDMIHYKKFYYEFVYAKWNKEFNTQQGKCRQYLLQQYLDHQ